MCCVLCVLCPEGPTDRSSTHAVLYDDANSWHFPAVIYVPDPTLKTRHRHQLVWCPLATVRVSILKCRKWATGRLVREVEGLDPCSLGLQLSVQSSRTRRCWGWVEWDDCPWGLVVRRWQLPHSRGDTPRSLSRTTSGLGTMTRSAFVGVDSICPSISPSLHHLSTFLSIYLSVI